MDTESFGSILCNPEQSLPIRHEPILPSLQFYTYSTDRRRYTENSTGWQSSIGYQEWSSLYIWCSWQRWYGRFFKTLQKVPAISLIRQVGYVYCLICILSFFVLHHITLSPVHILRRILTKFGCLPGLSFYGRTISKSYCIIFDSS